MKGFTSTETRFSLCGLNCALCSMHLGGYCPGCGGGAGNQSCAIAKCSLEHGGVPFCWECPEYPCPRYDGLRRRGLLCPHRNRQQDIAQCPELGLEAYLAQLEEKARHIGHTSGGLQRRPPQNVLPYGGLSSAPGGFTVRDGRPEQPAGAGRTTHQGAGPRRRGTASGGGGPPGHQPEAEQETEEGVSLCRLPR